MQNRAVTNATGRVLPNSAPEFSPDAVMERAKKTAAAMGELMQQTFREPDEQNPER
jgi:hypothetical protein